MIYTKVVGVTDHPIQLHEFLANTRISQSGISDGFLVTQADILGLKVKVALGRAFLIKDDNLIAYPVLSDASEEVIITANGSGNPRIDTIVLYYEEGAVGGSQGTEVAKLLVVDGFPSAIPSPPSDSDIISAMGGDYPYIPLADVSVSSGASQILNANITDRRTDFILDTPTDIHGLTAKTTPVDADELIISDSASSWLNKKITWANIKSTLLTYFMPLIYPIGSIYINATDNTNPATLLGFGTWSAFGAGRVPVGFDAGQTEFDTAEETGGFKTHTLTIAQMPNHTHTGATDTAGGIAFGPFKIASDLNTGAGGANRNNLETEDTGGGGAHNNLQPYITVYMWKRTA